MPLFAAALFLSSTLLFLIQPMIAKRILPMLGGTPGVWNTCMVFFQAMLLAGYGYSHYVSTRWPVRRQILFHSILLFVPIPFLLIGPPEWAPPGASNPIPWTLATLLVAVGAPFFVVSTSAPLLQKWFAGSGHPAAKDPYFLYGMSNLGSMVALVSYPALFEPLLQLEQQRWLWTFGYCAFAAVLLAVVVRVAKQSTSVADAPPVEELKPEPPPTWLLRLRWLGLSFVPSSLLLGVTTYLTTNISPFPLLWVIPLGLYLLTFILVFMRKPLLKHEWMVALQPWTLLALAAVFYWDYTAVARYDVMFPLNLVAFFVTTMVCHGELAKTRPSASHLTGFYFWMSLGGVLGGVFNALVAPMVFKTLIEYPVVLVIACLFRPSMAIGRRMWLTRLQDFLVPVAVVGFMFALEKILKGNKAAWGSDSLHLGVLIPACLLIGLLARHRSVRFALGVAAILAYFGYVPRPETVHQERSFFGTLRVEKWWKFNSLVHGQILHGIQNTEDPRDPLTYYHRAGPIGQVFEAYRSRTIGANISVVGLGAGTMAAYGEPGQTWTFYEIDPAVERIARNPKSFTYLADCRAHLNVVLGDGRLTLKRAGDYQYAIMAFDAFSSDAVPVHLLTREAIRMYLRKLAPNGIMAFHISSRFVDLEPILRELARDSALACKVQHETPLGAFEREAKKEYSTWVVLARSPQDLLPLNRYPNWKDPRPDGWAPVWTDDFSNILSILKLE